MSSPPSPAPGLADAASAPRLVLLPNTDDREEYTTDDDDDDNDNDNDNNDNVASDPQRQLPIPPLSPSVVFLYFLSPYLRLGAIYAFDIGDTSLTNALAGLFVAAFLSAFCRHIWFLLGRYLRRSSTQDILIQTFARRHPGVRKYGLARWIFTIISGLYRVLLAALYLRDSVDSVLLLQVPESIPFRSRFAVSILLSILVFVLSLPKSLASRSIVYTTALSVASYPAWLVLVSQSHDTNQRFLPNMSSLRRGVLWNEISSFVFACTTTMTVPLSASLITGASSIPLATRNARSRSFELLNVLSTSLGALLVLPIAIVSASSHVPVSPSTSNNLTLGFRIATIFLSIPSVVVSIISLPLHGVAYRFIRTNSALFIITVTILALNLVSPTIASILDDITLILAVSASFLLPALAHITVHYFRRPLSIVVPPAPHSAPNTPRQSSSERSLSPSRDPLLQRKERLLQRSRFGKRILWDIVIWIVLIPMYGYTFVWAVGRLARWW